MKFSRRGLMYSAGAGMLSAAAWTPFESRLDGNSPPKKHRAVLWCIFVAGNTTGTAGFNMFDESRKRAQHAGFEVLDSVHAVGENSKFLARMECSLAFARDQERKVLSSSEDAEILGGDSQRGYQCLSAIWVEVA